MVSKITKYSESKGNLIDKFIYLLYLADNYTRLGVIYTIKTCKKVSTRFIYRTFFNNFFLKKIGQILGTLFLQLWSFEHSYNIAGGHDQIE